MSLPDETIALVDKNGVVRIRLGIDDNGSPYFSLNGADGRERIILSVDDEGNGTLGFRTAKGQPTVSLGMSSDLGPGMTILDVPSETCLTLESGRIYLDTKQGAHTWPRPGAKPQPRD
jgi:hypothetical protein